MKNKAIQFLEAHESNNPSRFLENARRRKANRLWYKYTRGVALALIGYMDDHHLSKKELAESMGVTVQYLGRLLRGEENLTFQSLSQIEEKLGIECFQPVRPEPMETTLSV